MLNLDSRGTWGICILSQVEKHLAEALLARATGTTFNTFARDINQLCNAFPARAAGRGVLSVGKELLCLGAGLTASLVGAVSVRLVKVIDVFLGFLYRGSLLFCGFLGATRQIGVSAASPFPMVC